MYAQPHVCKSHPLRIITQSEQQSWYSWFKDSLACVCIYIYRHMYMYMCSIYTYIEIHIYIEREREKHYIHLHPVYIDMLYTCVCWCVDIYMYAQPHVCKSPPLRIITQSERQSWYSWFKDSLACVCIYIYRHMYMYMCSIYTYIEIHIYIEREHYIHLHRIYVDMLYTCVCAGVWIFICTHSHMCVNLLLYVSLLSQSDSPGIHGSRTVSLQSVRNQESGTSAHFPNPKSQNRAPSVFQPLAVCSLYSREWTALKPKLESCNSVSTKGFCLLASHPLLWHQLPRKASPTSFTSTAKMAPFHFPRRLQQASRMQVCALDLESPLQLHHDPHGRDPHAPGQSCSLADGTLAEGPDPRQSQAPAMPKQGCVRGPSGIEKFKESINWR